MSEDIKKLEERLEKATAPGDTIDVGLDAETTSLREGWLALGQLLEAAQPPSAGPPELQYPTPASPLRRRKPAAWKTPAALAALAASLLVAALLTWSFVGESGVNGRQDQQIVQDEKIETQSPAAIENVPPTALVKDERQPSDSAGDDLDWDAPLDTAITAAGQEMLRIQADWYASDDTSSSLYYRMQQMRKDLSDNTL